MKSRAEGGFDVDTVSARRGPLQHAAAIARRRRLRDNIIPKSRAGDF
jgi:hypothetical protein